jgi:hypothetical protein
MKPVPSSVVVIMAALWVHISLGQLPVTYLYSRGATVINRQQNGCRYRSLLHYKSHDRLATRPETEVNEHSWLKIIITKRRVECSSTSVLRCVSPLSHHVAHRLVGYFQMKLIF